MMIAMQVESLEILEKADLPPQQARAIVRAIEIEIGGARDTLATKDDVHALRQDIQMLRQDLTKDTRAVRDDLGKDIKAVRDDLGKDIQAVRHDLGKDIRAVRDDLGKDIHALDIKIEGVRTEIHSVEGKLTRHVTTVVFSGMLMVLGVVYFLFTHPPH
ncbi:MAG: hypothetical protein ACRDFS_01405 [Chloroflexota bacterium]